VIEEYPIIGYNYRLTDLQAAIGIEQMKRLDDLVSRRVALATRYNRLLSDPTLIRTFSLMPSQ
jgi:dTDP-4-amino-4,6-dideoxygalactose transaminase